MFHYIIYYIFYYIYILFFIFYILYILYLIFLYYLLYIFFIIYTMFRFLYFIYQIMGEVQSSPAWFAVEAEMISMFCHLTIYSLLQWFFCGDPGTLLVLVAAPDLFLRRNCNKRCWVCVKNLRVRIAWQRQPARRAPCLQWTCCKILQVGTPPELRSCHVMPPETSWKQFLSDLRWRFWCADSEEQLRRSHKALRSLEATVESSTSNPRLDQFFLPNAYLFSFMMFHVWLVSPMFSLSVWKVLFILDHLLSKSSINAWLISYCHID